MAIDLAGSWRIQLDRDDIGIVENWYQTTFPDDQTITLPGSLQAQGIGDDVTLETAWVGNIVDRSIFDDPRYAPYRQPDNIKFPSWLQPEKTYAGVAWYQREIEIPADWAGQRVTLDLERTHWETKVWLDDRSIGVNDSLSVAHAYDLGVDLTPGSHRLTVRVDNRMIVDVGGNAHGVSDHTQTNWNGIIGRLRLAAGSPVWMHNVQIFPDLAQGVARVKIDISSRLGRPITGMVEVTAISDNTEITHSLNPAQEDFHFSALGGLAELDLSTVGGHVDVNVPLDENVLYWDEFQPALYRMTVQMTATVDDQSYQDERTLTIGLRQIGVAGTQLTINGRPLFLRGTLECCIFPLTGYPPTDVEAWKRIVGICKAHGLNHIRFHSWCPPEAAFEAADELGFYLQVECPSWANQGAAVGEGRPLDEWLYREAGRACWPPTATIPHS